jgi:hypothetical protein
MRRGPSSFWGVGRNDGAREATVDSAVIAVIERLQRNGDYGQHIARSPFRRSHMPSIKVVGLSGAPPSSTT